MANLKSNQLLLLFVFLLSCTAKVPFVWVDTLPVVEQEFSPYQIQTGDRIEVSVWDQPGISGAFTVREDGMITVPLVGELPVSGLTPTEVSAAILAKLEGGIVQDARVVVISRETTPKYVTVFGEVKEPGQIELGPRDTIADILAKAGDLTDFADEKSIYLFRPTAPEHRFRFDYNRLTTLKTGGIRFKLQDGDVITVE